MDGRSVTGWRNGASSAIARTSEPIGTTRCHIAAHEKTCPTTSEAAEQVEGALDLRRDPSDVRNASCAP